MENYKFEPHVFNCKILNYSYCSKCGLIALKKNDFTQWAIKMGCNNEDHHNYKQQRLLTRYYKRK